MLARLVRIFTGAVLAVVISAPVAVASKPLVSPETPASKRAAAGPPRSDAQIVAALEAHLDSLTRSGRFSGAVLLARDGGPLFRRAYGLASRRDGIPNRPDTKFNLGSINKVFTRTAIAQLVAAGKLRLDDTVDKYLPQVPLEAAKKITIDHLLEHRAGVGDIHNQRYWTADRSRLRRVSDWLPLFVNDPLRFEPGTQSGYSNGGYVLLGAIIEAVSGQDYYDYVREHIYLPAGMQQTASYAIDETVPNKALGYTNESGDSLAENTPSLPGRGSPAGGGYSTVDDLLRFAQALRDGRLSTGEGPAVGIAGGSPGVNAVLESDGPYTLVVLANLDPPAAEEIGDMVRRWLLPAEAAGESQEGGRRVVVAGGGPGGERRVAFAGGGPGGGEPGGRGGPDPGDPPRTTTLPAAGVDVPMLRRDHMPAVEVMVNGQGPFLFTIDTGGAGSARIDSTLVARLGLPIVGEVLAGDPSGKNPRRTPVVGVKSIEVGGARFEGITAGTRNYNERPGRDHVDGILGIGLFADCLLDLDHPAGRIRLTGGALPEANGKDVLTYETRHGIPSVPVRVDSVTFDADLDTGAMGGFILPASAAERIALAEPPRVIGRARTVSNEFEITASKLKGSIWVGGYEFRGADVEFQPLFPTANIGSRALREFRLTIDSRNHRIRFARA